MLQPNELGHRAKILTRGIPVREVLETEVAELDEAVKRETDAVAAMEKKRAREIERGRAEIMRDGYRGVLDDSVTPPVSTRTPRLLVLGGNLQPRESTAPANYSKHRLLPRFGTI